MSTLHERLLAVTEPALPPFTVITRAHVDRPYGALRAVVELHAPKNCAEECHTYCVECDRVPASFVAWPCPTITAIASALGVEIGETP